MLPNQNTNPPTLEGTAVRIEPLAAHHAEAVAQAGGHEEIWPWMPCASIDGVDAARDWIADALARSDSLAFVVIDRASGRLAGSTRYLSISADHRRLEIGYTWLDPMFWRTVVNTEAKLLLLRYAFDVWGANRVEFKTDSRNERSLAALIRLGATREGTLRQHMVVRDGYVRDSVYFSIVRDEWPNVARGLEAAMQRHANDRPPS